MTTGATPNGMRRTSTTCEPPSYAVAHRPVHHQGMTLFGRLRRKRRAPMPTTTGTAEPICGTPIHHIPGATPPTVPFPEPPVFTEPKARE
jgi:hypothetical protein